jgi:hypothetical protein
MPICADEIGGGILAPHARAIKENRAMAAKKKQSRETRRTAKGRIRMGTASFGVEQPGPIDAGAQNAGKGAADSAATAIGQGAARGPSYLERGHRIAELASFLAIVVTAPLAYFEYRNNVQKEQAALAERVYRDVDERFVDYVKLCIDHPRLDGYSVPRADTLKPPLTADEKVQQRLLFTALTDVFEVAYVQYHKSEAVPEKVRKTFHDKQWPGWDTYIRKFLARPAYRKTWFDIRNEYDEDFVRYMDTIATPP